MTNPAGGAGKKEGRDSWVTPAWLAKLIGRVYLDPCSNPRSHIDAEWLCSLERGDNGLPQMCLTEPGEFWPRGCQGRATEDHTVFVNCPYAQGEVVKWVRHYRHTRFIYLLRWDPSTKWFAELIPHCTHVWFPHERINFEPPPGVKSSSNPFPHALYLRDPDPALLERLLTAGYLLPVDKGLLGAQSAPHGRLQRAAGTNGESSGSRGTEEAPSPG